MHRQIAARLFHNTPQPLQPRQRLAEALRHAVAIRNTYSARDSRYAFWTAVVEDLKAVHLKMPKPVL